jgi:guanylate cyclase
MKPEHFCSSDLKSSNVLVDSVLRAKVSDFGLARCGFDGGRRSNNLGSALWMAPELLRGGQPTLASDVYSYSILMTEVMPA